MPLIFDTYRAELADRAAAYAAACFVGVVVHDNNSIPTLNCNPGPVSHFLVFVASFTMSGTQERLHTTAAMT